MFVRRKNKGTPHPRVEVIEKSVRDSSRDKSIKPRWKNGSGVLTGRFRNTSKILQRRDQSAVPRFFFFIVDFCHQNGSFWFPVDPFFFLPQFVKKIIFFNPPSQHSSNNTLTSSSNGEKNVFSKHSCQTTHVWRKKKDECLNFRFRSDHDSGSEIVTTADRRFIRSLCVFSLIIFRWKCFDRSRRGTFYSNNISP